MQEIRIKQKSNASRKRERVHPPDRKAPPRREHVEEDEVEGGEPPHVRVRVGSGICGEIHRGRQCGVHHREHGEAHEEGGRGVGADEHGDEDREHRADAAQGVLFFHGAGESGSVLFRVAVALDGHDRKAETPHLRACGRWYIAPTGLVKMNMAAGDAQSEDVHREDAHREDARGEDARIENVHMENAATPQPCALCELTGGDNEIAEAVNAYVLENMGRVHLREMATQVCEQINKIPGKNMTPLQFEEHVRHHMRHQRVVLSMLLDDLLGVAGRARDACVVVDSETSAQHVDAKMLTAYLKTIDSINALYRSEALRERRE